MSISNPFSFSSGSRTPITASKIVSDLLGNPTPNSTITPNVLQTVSGTNTPVQSSTQTSSHNALLNQSASNPVSSVTNTTSTTASTGSNTSTSVNASSTGSIALSQLLTAATQPNILSNIQQSVYHFRLFMMSDTDLSVGSSSSMTMDQIFQKVNNTPKIIFAESGVTGYNIRDVSIDSFVAPSAETRNTNATKITITIVEPMGVTFLDSFRAAADALGIRNAQKCCHYLELTFKGYDPTTGEIIPNVLSSKYTENGGKWLYQIQIIDVDTSFDAGGGTYTLTCLPFSQSVFNDDDLLKTFDSLNVSGNTIGDLTTSFLNALNASWINRYGSRGGKGLVTYNAKFHPVQNAPTSAAGKDPSTFKITGQEPDKNPIRGYSLDAGGKATAHIAQGSNITDFFDFAFANSEEAHDLALDRDGTQGQTSSNSNSPNNSGFRASTIFRIEPDIKLVDYDWTTCRYIMEITLHVFPYYTQTPVTDANQRDSAQSPDVQAAMLKDIVNKGFYNKRYDYIFTGKNTEVLHYDIKFNFKYAVALASLEGGILNIDNVTVNARANPSNSQAQANTPVDQLQSLKTAYNDSQQKLTTTNSKLNDLQVQLGTLQNSVQNAPTQSAKVTAQGSLATVQAQYDQMVGARSSLISEVSSQSQQINTLQSQQYTQSRSQVSITANSVNYAEAITAQILNNKLTFPVSLKQVQRDTSDTVGTGFFGQYHRDKSLFGTVLGQLYAPLVQQFAKIELDIKGDPFWLGKTDLQTQCILRGGNPPPSYNPSSSDIVTPSFLSGDNHIIFDFAYPLGLDGNGVPQISKDETFIGLYVITQVQHTFSEGEFKQRLIGLRQPLSSISLALSGNAANAGNNSPKTTTTNTGVSTSVTNPSGRLASQLST